MFSQRALLLIVFWLLFFSPAIEMWLYPAGNYWYSPFIMWLVFIVIVFIATRPRNSDEL